MLLSDCYAQGGFQRFQFVQILVKGKEGKSFPPTLILQILSPPKWLWAFVSTWAPRSSSTSLIHSFFHSPIYSTSDHAHQIYGGWSNVTVTVSCLALFTGFPFLPP